MELKVSITTQGKIFDGKGPEIVQRNLEDFLYEATMFLEAEVKKGTPTGVFGASGGLLSTIHGEVVEKGSPTVKGIVGHQSIYGDVIEMGRRAGKAWPPEGVLLRWIEMKMGVDAVQAKRLEFVIRRKIGQKGFPGAHMFQNAFERGWPKLVTMADKKGFDIAKELNS